MQKVDDTEGSSNERKDSVASGIDFGSSSGMWEYVPVTQLSQGKLSIICVGSKVFDAIC